MSCSEPVSSEAYCLAEGWSRGERTCTLPFVHPAWGSQQAAPTEEAVPPNSDGGAISRRAARCRGLGSSKVAADHDLGLDDSLASEHDVLGANESCLAGDFIARVLQAAQRRERQSWWQGDICSRVFPYGLDILAPGWSS